MTPKEELIQAIERSPDEVIRALLELLKVFQKERSPEVIASVEPMSESMPPEKLTAQLHRKQGILVIETSGGEGVDIDTAIAEIREDQARAKSVSDRLLG